MISYNNEHYIEYEVLDKNLNKVSTEIPYFEDGGKITYNSLDRLKSSCEVKVSYSNNEEINIEALRIYSVMNGERTCLGTFFIKRPDTNTNDCLTESDLIGNSTLIKISTNTPDNKYYVPRGTNCISEVKRILTNLNCSYEIPDLNKSTSTDIEFNFGTNYLDIINYLLDVVNYTSLYTDVYGKYISKPYILPNNREVDLVLDQSDENNIIEVNQKRTLDTSDVPNKFIRYCCNDPNVNLYAVYEKTDGITGTSKTWVNTSSEEVKDVADYDTLYEICKKAAAEASSIYERVEIKIGLKMLPCYMPTIQLNHYKASGKYTCTSFEIELMTGGGIDMALRKVVNV